MEEKDEQKPSRWIPKCDREVRDQKVIKLLCEGVKPRDALLEVGYAESTATQRTTQVVDSIIKRSPMISALDQVGVTTQFLARTVRRGLRAKKTQRLVVDKSVAAFTDIDHGTRHRFLETALRLRGEDPDRQTTGTEETYEQRVRRLRAAGSAALLKKTTGVSVSEESEKGQCE